MNFTQAKQKRNAIQARHQDLYVVEGCQPALGPCSTNEHLMSAHFVLHVFSMTTGQHLYDIEESDQE